MKKIIISAFILAIIIVLTGYVTLILAQEKKEGSETSGIVVLGGLKLKSGTNQEGAEKLFKENLIPLMQEVDGLEMKILKHIQMPNEKPEDILYDYIMMAEIKDQQVLMKMMQNRDDKLSKFGEMMKQYAGGPDLKMYTIIAKTEKAEKE